MTAKTVYQLDRSGLFAGETTADESPLEPGVWLMPARTIDTPPPSDWPAGMWPRWNGTAWETISQPSPVAAPSAAEKLAEFLAENPDVAAMIGA